MAQALRYTPGQIMALLALVAAGTLDDARRRLELTPSAMKSRLVGLRYRNHLTNVQLAYLLGRLDPDGDLVGQLQAHDIEDPKH